MAEELLAISEAMNLLEAEPSSGPVGVVPDFATPGPDIPALREQLAVLVLTGKAKEAIGVQLTYEQVKRLSDKDVEKYYKRYEAFVGAKTTDSLIGSFIFLASKSVGMAVTVKDVEPYKKTQKRLHHQQRALQPGGQPCIEVRPVSRSGQRGADHHKAH